MGKVIKTNDFLIGANSSKVSDYREYQKEQMQSKIDSEFEMATDVFKVGYESIVGSNSFSDITARLERVLTPDKNAYIGDDYLKILPSSVDIDFRIGARFTYNNDYWLCFNTDNITSITKSGILRRCNSSLKWRDEYGNILEEPCVIDYFKFTYTYNNVDFDKTMRLGGNQRFVVLQENENSLKIKRDMRFIFNDMAWRVANVEKTTHKGLIEISAEEHQFNEDYDDMVNRIADNIVSGDYSIVASTGDFSLNIGDSETVVYNVYKSANIVPESCTLTSSDEEIISIDGNNVTALSEGFAFVTIALDANPLISATIAIEVKAANATAHIVGEDITRFGGTYRYLVENNISTIYDFSCVDNTIKITRIDNFSCDVTVPATAKSFILVAEGENGDILTKEIGIRSMWT